MDYENKWKAQFDDPEHIAHIVPEDVQQRIEDRLFPPASRKVIPFWVSHAAAVAAGIFGTALFFLLKPSNDTTTATIHTIQQPVSRPVVPDHNSDTDIRNHPLTTGSNEAYRDKAVTAKTATAEHPRLLSGKQSGPVLNALPLMPGDSSNAQDAFTDTKAHKREPLSTPYAPYIAQNAPVSKRVKVIPVSDLNPVSESRSWINTLILPKENQSNNLVYSSPFNLKK